MTRQRLNLDPPSKLTTREGQVVGTIHSITVDLDVGDIGGSSSAEQNNDLTRDGGVGEGQQPLAPMSPEEIGAYRIVSGKPRKPTEVKQAVDFVLAHYVAVMKPRTATFGEDDRRIVRDALKVATVAECCRAIDGCAASEFHMGTNDRNRKYNALSQILKGKRGIKTTREQISMFLEIAERNPASPRLASADDARVQQAKRDVLTAHEFPGDEHAQQAGNEAAEWLEQNGWKVIRDVDGARPRFEAQA